jgi:hypothetical protein
MRVNIPYNSPKNAQKKKKYKEPILFHIIDSGRLILAQLYVGLHSLNQCDVSQGDATFGIEYLETIHEYLCHEIEGIQNI